MANIVSTTLRSPTMMTWCNLGLRMLGFAVLLPLVLTSLTVEEANLWLLFQAVLALQGMVDFGFTPTFVRIVSYARAGKITARTMPAPFDPGAENENSLRRVIRTMRSVYNRLSIMAFFLVALGGTLAVMRPVSLLESTDVGWVAWACVAVGGFLTFRGGMYGAYMQGVDQIALYQRWQIVAGAISVIGSIVVIVLGGGLVLLVVIMQAGSIIGVLITRALVTRHSPVASWSESPLRDPEVMESVWPAAWRSGLGVAMTYGTIQGAGIIYAQVASPSSAAAFLLAQRVVRMLSSFANAPFYTCIPHMSRLYAEGKQSELVKKARAGMLRANWALVTGIVVIGLAADPLLALIGSHTPFVSPSVWWLLGLATLFERIGAMHLQLYSTTNHIVWHFANGFSGAVMLLAIPLSYQVFGVEGLPIGIIISYGCVYIPYSLFHSYRTFHLNLFQMDLLGSIVPALLVLTFLLDAIWHRL